MTIHSDPEISPIDIPTSHADIFSEIQTALDSEIRSLINREKVGISSRFDIIETEQKALKLDQFECRTKIDTTIQLLEKLEINSEVTSSRLDSLEARVDLIDINLKSYVDSHVRKVNRKIDESRISHDKEERQRLNPTISTSIAPISSNIDVEFNPTRASTSSENPLEIFSDPIPPITSIEPEPEKNPRSDPPP